MRLHALEDRTPAPSKKPGANFGLAVLELVRLDGDVVGRFVLEPGWHWEEHVKPIAGTDWCEVEHYQVVQSGRLHVKMNDGVEFDLGPGEVAHLAPGHDAWVVGDEPFVAIDWSDSGKYARR